MSSPAPYERIPLEKFPENFSTLIGESSKLSRVSVSRREAGDITHTYPVEASLCQRCNGTYGHLIQACTAPAVLNVLGTYVALHRAPVLYWKYN